MERTAVIIARSADNKRMIAVDAENYDQILTFLNKDVRHRSKFNDIVNILFSNLRNTQLYDKEEPDSKSKGVRAMKFFKGQENARIYCREVTMLNKSFVIIASEILIKKKTQKLDHKILSLIHKVAKYEYRKIIDPRTNLRIL